MLAERLMAAPTTPSVSSKTSVPMRDDPPHVEREVLEIVSGLMRELGGTRADSRVTLDDSLERDLGLGSLERVELLVRLEHAMGVRLPDAVMAEAESPRHLVAALQSGLTAPEERIPERAGPTPLGAAAPATARTLVDALRWHAEQHADRPNVYLRE